MSGKLGFQEFSELWVYICMCKKVFIEYDQDKSGSFSSFELQVCPLFGTVFMIMEMDFMLRQAEQPFKSSLSITETTIITIFKKFLLFQRVFSKIIYDLPGICSYQISYFAN